LPDWIFQYEAGSGLVWKKAVTTEDTQESFFRFLQTVFRVLALKLSHYAQAAKVARTPPTILLDIFVRHP
jgi:hypothetical protein